jgi:hypothetical protein
MRRQGPERLPPTRPRPPNAAEPCDLSQPYTAHTTRRWPYRRRQQNFDKAPINPALGCFDPAEQRPDAGGKSLVPAAGPDVLADGNQRGELADRQRSEEFVQAEPGR